MIIGSEVVAFPILILIVVVIIYAEVNKDFDVFKFIIDNPITYIVAGILLMLVLILALCFYIIKRKLYYKIYPDLKDKLNIN